MTEERERKSELVDLRGDEWWAGRPGKENKTKVIEMFGAPKSRETSIYTVFPLQQHRFFKRVAPNTLFPLQQHRFFKGVAPSVKMSHERPVISP